MNVQPKVLPILKSMLLGIPVTVRDWTFVLDENFNLGVYGKKIVLGEEVEQDCTLRVDWTLGEFIRYCNELPDDDFAILCANLTLNERHLRKY